MKITKILGVVAVAAMALMAFAGTASATTLEVKGAKQTGSVTLDATLEAGTSAELKLTNGELVNTCTESTVKGSTTTPFTAAGTGRIGGPISTLTFNKCLSEPVVVDNAGYLTVEWIKGTTNGTIYSDSASVTVPSPIFPGSTLDCTTPATGTDIGTLTGKASGSATMDIKATLNCGFFAPSALWEGKYLVTSPEGLGVTE